MAAPFATPVANNQEHILNYCTKYLIRGSKFFINPPGTESVNLREISERWRFPIVEPVLNSQGLTGTVNEITFIWLSKPDDEISGVSVVGSFAPLYTATTLLPVVFDNQPTGIFACTIQAPVGKGYYYQFLINGSAVADPINLQRKKFSNGKEWSFFFTDYYNSSQEFEEWEMNILARLAGQIVPFRSKEAQNFINRFYLSLAKPDKLAMPIYKLDESVGEINYVTNVLAREERHHLQDYKTCLLIIDQVLRKRNPFTDSWMVSEEIINELYNEMASGNVPDWDYSAYSNPTYFLGLLRRHVITGAFSHPKYGGNIGGVGWNYLQERYSIKDNAGRITDSYFNWQKAIEKNLGSNAYYQG